jgi:3-hydroxyacyl-[acyl-carrier-protein] dehydratase
MEDGSKMILKDFYKIQGRSGPETEVNPAGMTIEKYRFSLELNPEHPVYEGHFPGNPVVPGVCQVQMICELLSMIKGYPVRLVHADTIKFMTLMVPGENRLIEAFLSLRESFADDIPVNATLQNGSVVFIKFKGIFRKE